MSNPPKNINRPFTRNNTCNPGSSITDMPLILTISSMQCPFLNELASGVLYCRFERFVLFSFINAEAQLQLEGPPHAMAGARLSMHCSRCLQWRGESGTHSRFWRTYPRRLRPMSCGASLCPSRSFSTDCNTLVVMRLLCPRTKTDPSQLSIDIFYPL